MAENLNLLDGVRALSHIGIVSVHVVTFLGIMFSRETLISLYYPTTSSSVDNVLSYIISSVVVLGACCVDSLFILSGFFAMRSLYNILTSSSSSVPSFSHLLSIMPHFYWRRLVRLLPLLYMASCFVALLTLAEEKYSESISLQKGLWYDLTLMSNQVSVQEAFLGYAWSLSVDWHGYLLCPLFFFLFTKYSSIVNNHLLVISFFLATVLNHIHTFYKLFDIASVCESCRAPFYLFLLDARQKQNLNNALVKIVPYFDNVYQTTKMRIFPIICGFILFFEWKQYSQNQVQLQQEQQQQQVQQHKEHKQYKQQFNSCWLNLFTHWSWWFMVGVCFYLVYYARQASSTMMLRLLGHEDVEEALSHTHCILHASLMHPLFSLSSYYLIRYLLFSSISSSTTLTSLSFLSHPILSYISELNYANYLFHLPLIIILHAILAETGFATHILYSSSQTIFALKLLFILFPLMIFSTLCISQLPHKLETKFNKWRTQSRKMKTL